MVELLDELIDDAKEVRYLVYKRMFTPFEQEEKFEDQSEFEDNYFSKGIIDAYCVLPDKDVLIKFKSLLSDDEIMYNYYKLSEIRLSVID